MAVLILGALVNSSQSGYRMLVQVPDDHEMQSLYLKVSMDATQLIHDASLHARIHLNPFPTYTEAPIMRFLLLKDINDRRVVPAADPPRGLSLWKFFRDPVHGSPVLFLDATGIVEGERFISMANMDDELRPGLDAERHGRWGAAEQHYRSLIRIAGPFGQARARLALVLFRQGKVGEARRELRAACVEGMRREDMDFFIRVIMGEGTRSTITPESM